jgi:hypothetical protein
MKAEKLTNVEFVNGDLIPLAGGLVYLVIENFEYPVTSKFLFSCLINGKITRSRAYTGTYVILRVESWNV